jgi:integrase/recombinase XerD
MNSQQGKRYIKPRMGDELKNKILEHSGIKIANKQTQSVSRTCGRCGYVNRLESKYCESAKGYNYPLTQLALDEIKAAEQEKFQVLRNEILETKAVQQKKDDEIQMLKEEIEEIRYLYQDLIQRNTVVRNFNHSGDEISV